MTINPQFRRRKLDRKELAQPPIPLRGPRLISGQMYPSSRQFSKREMEARAAKKKSRRGTSP